MCPANSTWWDNRHRSRRNSVKRYSCEGVARQSRQNRRTKIQNRDIPLPREAIRPCHVLVRKAESSHAVLEYHHVVKHVAETTTFLVNNTFTSPYKIYI